VADFGELKALVLRDLERDDLSTDSNANIDDTTIEYYIKRSIDHFKTKQFWFNQRTATTVTIAANSDTASLPNDFISAVIFRVTTNGSQRILTETHYEELETARAISQVINSSAPTLFSIFGEQFEFYPTPTQSISTKLSYIFELTELSADSDSNTWTNDARMMISAKTKEYIYRDRLRNSEAATRAALEVEQELQKLTTRTNKNVAIGMVRIESWLG